MVWERGGKIVRTNAKQLVIVAVAVALVAGGGFSCSSSDDTGTKSADGGGGSDGGEIDSGTGLPSMDSSSSGGIDSASPNDGSTNDGFVLDAGPPGPGGAYGTCTINSPSGTYNGSAVPLTPGPGSGFGYSTQSVTDSGTQTLIGTVVSLSTVGRGCGIVIDGPLAVGSYVATALSGGVGLSGLNYSESSKQWGSYAAPSGSVTVDSVNGKTFTFTIHAFAMSPQSGGAAGTFQMGGSGIATLP
jgi:hypothetical protein